MAIIDTPVLPPRLYRFRKVQTAESAKRELDAIAGNYLWCSRYRDLNDPMEGVFGVSRWVTKQQTYREVVRIIRDEKQLVGICCFSDSYNNELMWAHYTENFSGICVGYSTSRLREGLGDQVHIARVAYDERPPRVGRADLDCLRHAARQVLSHKKACWLYEREWRILTNPEEVQPPGPLQIRVDGAVKSVYLGPRIQHEIKNRMINELNRMDINIRTMAVSEYNHQWRPYDGNA
jgi:hypothetical protein